MITAVTISTQLFAGQLPSVCQGVISNEVAKDPFFVAREMSDGPYQGECLANEKRRNIVILKNDDKRLKNVVGAVRSGHVYFANFRHNNRYYIAEYTPGSIDQTYLAFEKFVEGGVLPKSLAPIGFKGSQMVFTGHIQFRFMLKQGAALKLYEQTSRKVIQKPTQITDFSYAMYAIRPESLLGTTYDPFGEGRSAGYAMSHNFLSTHDVAIEYKNYIRPEKARVGQYKLESSGLDFEKMMMALLKQSDGLYKSKKSEIYDTFINNCVTAAYAGIVAGDKHQGKSSPRWYRFYSRHLIANKTGGREFNPMSVFSDLERRKILTHRNRSQVKDFNDEICSLLTDEFRPEGCE